MSLYFVRHQHTAETCPAKDPAMGAMLLQHLSPLNARKFGVDIQGEAVLDNQHTFVLILEAGKTTRWTSSCSRSAGRTGGSMARLSVREGRRAAGC